MTSRAGVDFNTSFKMRTQSRTRFTGLKLDRWINCFSFGWLSGFGLYRSQLTKLWMTRISFATPKTSVVLSWRYLLMVVMPSDFSIENFVIGKYDLSAPTSVISVPCKVVTNGSLRAETV